MLLNDRQRRAMFARLGSVSSLSPDDTDLKQKLEGRFVSLADRYRAPEPLLMQHDAYGLDVDGVLVTKNFVPKFRIGDAGDYFEDINRNTLYVTNYKDLPKDDFVDKVSKIKSVAAEKQLKVEGTMDPQGF